MKVKLGILDKEPKFKKSKFIEETNKIDFSYVDDFVMDKFYQLFELIDKHFEEKHNEKIQGMELKRKMLDKL